MIEQITKEEFEEWTQNIVTKAVMNMLKREVETMMFGLAESAGTDSHHDRYICGRIHALTALTNITFEEATEKDAN